MTDEYFHFRSNINMAAKYAEESGHILRFSDLTSEPRRMLPPIQGYENMPLVSLEEAINPLVSIVPDVERMAWTVKQNHFEEKDGLTHDESASVLLYSMEWHPRDKSFYIILNNTLQSANRQLLQPWFLYLRLVLTSLAKLPSEASRLTVYRGVKKDFSALYSTGSTVTWWAFSSCATSIDALNNEQFLGVNGTRTLFTIDCHSGKSIRNHTIYPEEEEVLLPPARQFQVMGCLNQGNGLHIIQLKEIQPKYPLINPVQLPPTIQEKPTHQAIKPTLEKALTEYTKPVPTCNDPELHKYIDALYLDPVIS
jgi:hypothetical protein